MKELTVGKRSNLISIILIVVLVFAGWKLYDWGKKNGYKDLETKLVYGIAKKQSETIGIFILSFRTDGTTMISLTGENWGKAK